VKQYAKEYGLRFEWRPDLGKGSHGVLLLGERRTVVRNPKDELKTGTLRAMLKQLGLSPTDI
jgi:mRNA interferase HicA